MHTDEKWAGPNLRKWKNKIPKKLILIKISYRSMSPSNKLSRPTLKRTNECQRKRTRTDSNKPGPSIAALLEPPTQAPKRARSASPIPRDPDLEPPRTRRARHNSAGPSYDPTPYSLSVDYVDRSTGRTQDYFVETLSNHALSNRKFKIDRYEAISGTFSLL